MHISHPSNAAPKEMAGGKLIAQWTLACVLALSGATASAQDTSSADLAKSLANPVANLISVPIQLNYDQGYGTANGNATTLNVQPVIPISLNEDWNLISRTIIPLRSQNDVFGNSGTQTGVGDIVQSVFFSPKKPTDGGLIWGLGPVFLIPTSTDPLIGAGEWGIGPTGVALIQKGPWTYGGLANHIWSLDGNTTVNSTFLQPFLSYTTADAWTYTLQSESTYDWNSESWTVPINALVSKVVPIGDQLVSLTAGAGYYADSPANGPDGWRARLAVTYLFPK
ncbi:MAG: transporter [Marinosulfonomonas sp.]